MAGDAQSHGDHRGLLRVIAAQSPVPLHVCPSVGAATCMFCHQAIVPGSLQYEIGRCTILADDYCYQSILRELIETPRAS